MVNINNELYKMKNTSVFTESNQEPSFSQMEVKIDTFNTKKSVSNKMVVNF